MNHEESLAEIFEYYEKQLNPSQQNNIVAMLREIQDLLGCVPEGVQAQAANAVGTKESVIRLLVQRFPSLRSASYQHRIIVCSGQRCGSKNAAQVLSFLRKELEIDPEGYSKDKTIFLSTQNCLKQCGKGPNLLLDGVLHSAMTPEKAKQLLCNLKK